MNELMTIIKALSDPNRVRAVMFLRGGELCLCQVIKMLGLAPSTASKHMAVLQQAGLVHTRKDGRWTYYRLAGPKAPRRVRQAIAWLKANLTRDRQVRLDAGRVRRVRKMCLSDLCGRYRNDGAANRRPARRGGRIVGGHTPT